jgi:hypothetical protein
LLLGCLLLLASGGDGGAARAQARTIKVVAGDTLEQLALQQGVSLDALMALNGIRDPRSLQIGQRLLLPNRPSQAAPSPAVLSAALPRKAPEPLGPLEPPVDGTGLAASAALLLSPAERRDRAELALREQSGQARWKWFNRTAVDWAGWKLTTSGARFTLVKASDADLGVSRGAASAVAVQCETLRQTWRVNGQWLPWGAAAPGSVGQRIVLDLCSNTLNDPAVPLPPAPRPCLRQGCQAPRSLSRSYFAWERRYKLHPEQNHSGILQIRRLSVVRQRAQLQGSILALIQRRGTGSPGEKPA